MRRHVRPIHLYLLFLLCGVLLVAGCAAADAPESDDVSDAAKPDDAFADDGPDPAEAAFGDAGAFDEPGHMPDPNFKRHLGTDNSPDDALVEPELGDNPAMEDGPYDVERLTIELPHESRRQTAYFYVPKNTKKGGPFPTLVWGHGRMSAYQPTTQAEMLVRQASKGFLVIYPNMEVPLANMEGHNITKSVLTYLHAIRKAVQLGYADPDKIIFGGYSMGGRVAALAAAMTTGLDFLNVWPNPIACVYEAMRDYNPENIGSPFVIPGPLPSEWASLIDPTIPQTIICAESDRINPCVDRQTGEPLNGLFFLENLESRFAQAVILNDGSTIWDQAGHDCFHAMNDASLDALDLWGHMKIVGGLTRFHFEVGSREWAYGAMRTFGGWDSAGETIYHDVIEIHGEKPHTDTAENAFGAK